MKKLFAFLFFAFSLALQAQFEDLATVEFSIENDKENVYELSFTIKLNNGSYVYGQSNALISPPELILNLDSSPNYKPLNDWQIPDFKTKYIKEFEGDVDYFDGKELVATRSIKGFVKDFSVTGNYQVQVCNKGTCITSPYPNPTFQVNVGKGSTVNSANGPPKTNNASSSLLNDDEYDFSKEKKGVKNFNNASIDEGEDKGLFAFFIIAFISGLAALLTPCVFPMIPMTVTFFLKKSESGSRGKFLAIIFGLSIILIYVGIGVIINLFFDEDTANYIATHWVPNIIFFLVFVFFAASFFGMFEITLPGKWSNISDKNGIEAVSLVPSLWP